MKKLALILVGILLSPSVAYAALSITEVFNYTDESDIHSQSGGSGWSAAWDGTPGGTGKWLADTAQFIEGTASARVQSAGSNVSPDYRRAITTALTGTTTIMHIAFRCDDVGGGATGEHTLMVSSTDTLPRYAINVDCANTKLWITDGSTNVDLDTSVAADTWYHCYLDIDVTNNRHRGYCSTSIPEAVPTWSSYINNFTGAGESINLFRITGNTGAVTSRFWADDIRDVGTDFEAPAAQATGGVFFRAYWW